MYEFCHLFMTDAATFLMTVFAGSVALIMLLGTLRCTDFGKSGM